MADPTPLNRNQIARFVGNDPHAIRALERLFVVAGQLTPADILTLTQLILDNTFAVGAVDNKAEVAQSDATAAKRLADLLAVAPIRETHNSVATDYIDLNPSVPIPADKPGRAYWNLDDGTIDVDLYGGSVLQVGQEMLFYAKNTSGSLIPDGTPVMFTGSVGASGKLTFGLAVADGSVPSNYMMGVTTQDVADNAFGYVTSFGLVRGFDTTGTPYGQVWADGDLLYFDPLTPGDWTNVQPDAPNIDVPVAVVVNAAPGGSGSIFVRMVISQRLNTLQDVYINGTGSPVDGDVLIYDAGQFRWQNKSQSNLVSGSASRVQSQYDSGWVAATRNSNQSFTHNLGTNLGVTPDQLVVTILVKDGSGRIFQYPTGFAANASNETDITIWHQTNDVLQLGFGNDGIYAYDNTTLSGSVTLLVSGDVRVKIMVLE